MEANRTLFISELKDLEKMIELHDLDLKIIDKNTNPVYLRRRSDEYVVWCFMDWSFKEVANFKQGLTIGVFEQFEKKLNNGKKQMKFNDVLEQYSDKNIAVKEAIGSTDDLAMLYMGKGKNIDPEIINNYELNDSEDDVEYIPEKDVFLIFVNKVGK